MWRPERAVRGPFPAAERDIPAMNRLFAESFTDRYRRDGLVGVRVPFLNEAVWRYALRLAGPGAMLWRDESDRLLALNLAHHSGVEGWMGPLCVRPDRQLAGTGQAIVQAAMQWLQEQHVATLGLETMPRTVDNIGFYSRLGFVPGHLTLTMTSDAASRPRPLAAAVLAGQGTADERAARAAAVRAFVAARLPGVDFSREVALTLELGLGDCVLLEQSGRLRGFALCHSVPLADGGARDEVRVLKVGAEDVEALAAVLDAAAAWTARIGARRLAVRCQSGDAAAYAALIARGWRVRWSDLRMTLAGFAEQRPAEGVIWSNWEI